MIELFEVVPIELTEVSFTERCSKSTISFRYITDEEAKVQTPVAGAAATTQTANTNSTTTTTNTTKSNNTQA